MLNVEFLYKKFNKIKTKTFLEKLRQDPDIIKKPLMIEISQRQFHSF